MSSDRDMRADYRQGREDGLREAVEIIRGLEDRVVAKLFRPAERRARDARRVRSRAFAVAATRITTALRKRERSGRGRTKPEDLCL